MKKNDVITLEITGMTSEGSGVGKYDGMAVFVPMTAPGDVAQVLILKVKKSYAYGKIKELITAGNGRVTPDCESFFRCGGCVYRHLDYATECSIKQERVQDAVMRIGGFELLCQPIIPAVSPERYRNKAQYPIAPDGSVGFFAVHSHRIISCGDCALQPKEFAAVAETVKQWITDNGVSVYDEGAHKGLLRHLYIRKGTKSGELMVVLVINGGDIPASDALVAMLKSKFGSALKSIQLNINREKTNVILGKECKVLYGEAYIVDVLCGVRVRLSPLSFYQVNRDMAERLYEKAAEYAEAQGKDILDLYCGAGTIGLSMAKSAKSVIGVEIVEQAIEDARVNAAENGITNARFICADAAEAADRLAKEGVRPQVVIVDPPRKGCTPELLQVIAEKFAPERLVYVSCDPATLARDAAIMRELGYELKEYTPVDLFPRTAHVETVAYLSRQIDVHKMKLNSAPFEMIKSGEKTIELRLYDEKRQRVKVGDKIVFTNSATGEKLNTTVMKLHRFNTFNELYKSLPLLKCGYTSENVDKATPSDMERYYSPEEQKKYGVVGIELCCLEQIVD